MSATSTPTGLLGRLADRMRRLAGRKTSQVGTQNTRLTSRFPIQLPLRVKYGPALSLETSGNTRDLSVGGIFFVTPDTIPLGEEIELLVPVPPPLAKAGKMWMFCTARVVRTQKSPPGETGVAALISGYKLTAEA